MTVRSAQLNDLPHLMILWEDRQVLLQQSDSRFKQPDVNRDHWKAYLDHCILDDLTLMLANVIENKITGFIIVEITDASDALISAIVLDSHKYHPGVGRKLVYAVRERLSTRDISNIAVIVPRFHAVEQAFWRALGAKEVNGQDWIEQNWELPAGCMWMTL